MNQSPLEIYMFPCLSDNYGFLIHDNEKKLTATIDTPEVSAIEKALDINGWELTHILNTHHHYDHAGGNIELKNKTDCQVIGPKMDQERIPGIDKKVSHEEVFYYGNHKVISYHTPGHTTGHIVYHFENEKIAFVGDTIFAMGCGRLFEGTAEQMWNSLNIITNWPDETKLYCAHEYTKNNAEFAITIDPINRELIERINEVNIKRMKNIPTVPTNVGIEKLTNPFVRANDSKIKQNLDMTDQSNVSVFAEIRKRKDNF
ncbi:MAG: hydroxyacylglutathione hydrolase [Gammaproteobacteria bacterium]|nr:hydroxyacylglutathione hydrolase [Gammaproteobacteria bacterium]